MKIGVLTEGDSEVQSLVHLFTQINKLTRHTLLRPLKINVHPAAAPEKIARECKRKFPIALAFGADHLVVLLDRENRPECPGKLATDVQRKVHAVCNSTVRVSVVLKDSCFENWLIADPTGLSAHPKRFNVTPSVRRQISPNKADRCDAYKLLSGVTVGAHYDKVADSQRIARNLDVIRAATNSRSFRHFLHVCEVGQYLQQCKRP